ncbi:uncharacterized protein LOC142235815 [Haematobia irritans]|uniref:uncharacterized protein LOC142235815 n=1 Tax=Haematobia irritans TaxID=7368 RepID=UPI003F504513
MYYIVIFIILGLLAWGYVLHASKKPMRDAVKLLNGPYCFPLLGALHIAYGLTPQNIFKRVPQYHKKYGKIFRIWVFNRLVLSCADVEMNEQILSSPIPLTKNPVYRILRHWLGTGLLSSDGAKWHARRKIITPAFHFKILEEFIEIFNQQSEIAVNCLANEADGRKAFDIYPYVCSATLDIIAETAMGTKINAQTDSSNQYTRAVDEMTKIMSWRFLRYHIHNDVVFAILHPFKSLRVMKCLRIMYEFTNGVIRERRETLKRNLSEVRISDIDPEINNDVGVKRKMALLDVLLQSQINDQPLSDEDIREEVETFMFEGHDTTATSLAFTLYILARSPRVQKKLLAEIEQVYGYETNTACTMANLNEMKYLDCVIKESLRLYPPAPIIGRMFTEDFHYKHSIYGEGVIPAGTEMVFNLFAMGSSSHLFENPSEFLPERHEELNDPKKVFHYIPFSAGPRNCIGQKFAQLELKVVLIHILRAYELLPLGMAIEEAHGIVLRSTTGMQLGIKKRFNCGKKNWTMYILSLFVIGLCVAGYWFHVSKKPMRDAVKNIAGPLHIPLLGSVHFVLGITPQNIFKRAFETSVKYGYMLKLWMLHRLIVVSADPEMNEQILSSTTHISKHHLYGVLHQWLGNGLLISDGHKWHSRRKIITPTFHFKILEQFLDVFHQQSEVFVNCLASKADGVTVFNVYPYVCAATLDIIAETAMGTKVMAQTDINMEYTKAVHEMTQVMAWRFLNMHLHNDLLFSILHPFQKIRMMKNFRILREFTHKVIKERRKALEQKLNGVPEQKNTDDHNDIGLKKRMALLDVLLQSNIDGQPLTDEDIREEVDTFMFEGHDTTASALAFTLYLLARNPRVQNKLLAEIRQVYGDDNVASASMMTLHEMKYLECVIKESLRLYPPVPIIARRMNEDFSYKHSTLGDGVIPAGSEVVLFIFAMAEFSYIYENPKEFIPERHEDVNSNTNFHYIPFSAGPRNCIGQKFAMLEMKVVLSHIIQAYELLPLGENIQPTLGLVLRSVNGMQLGMRRRTT